MADEQLTEALDEEIDLDDWCAGALPEERTYRLEDERPDVVAKFREAGYEDGIWFKLRALRAAEKEDRQTRMVEFRGDMGEPTAKWGVSGSDIIRYNVSHMVVDAEFPLRREDGRYRRYRWNQAEGRMGDNVRQVMEMGEGLLLWLLSKIEEMSGEDFENVVAEAKNSFGAPEPA